MQQFFRALANENFTYTVHIKIRCPFSKQTKTQQNIFKEQIKTHKDTANSQHIKTNKTVAIFFGVLL